MNTIHKVGGGSGKETSATTLLEDDLTHWKEVCYAHEAELQWLRADAERMGEALVYIGNVCIRYDQGDEMGRVLGHIADHARAALEIKK